MPQASSSNASLTHNYSQLQGPIILLIVALCIDRGVRRFENAAILFDTPATTMAFPCKSARMPLTATGRGFIVRRRNKGEAVATGYVAKSASDGYTLLVGTDAQMDISPHIQKNLPYDPKECTPIIQAAMIEFVLSAHPAEHPDRDRVRRKHVGLRASQRG